MYFCPNCLNNLDIGKSSSKVEDKRIPINKMVDALKLLQENEDLLKYKANFDKNELTKNKKYQTLNEPDKYKINQLFNEMVSSGAEFKCNNCNYNEPITKTTLLYRIDNNASNNIKSQTLEENELIFKDPLLPHTKDYNCKNPKCITHKDNNKKDSVFYKGMNSYKLNYICGACYYNW
jgi:hypothetical protein